MGSFLLHRIVSHAAHLDGRAWPRQEAPGRRPRLASRYRVAMAPRLVTERLALRSWNADDAAAALGVYGDAEVARWLAPAMDRVHDLAAMRLVLQQWVAEDARMLTPAGRWAIEARADGRLIGGATLLPLPPDEEFEIGWQLQLGRMGPRLRDRDRAGARPVGLRAGDRAGYRGRAADEHAGRGDGTPYRHGVGRRDREIPQPAPAGLPAAPRGPCRTASLSVLIDRGSKRTIA